MVLRPVAVRRRTVTLRRKAHAECRRGPGLGHWTGRRLSAFELALVLPPFDVAWDGPHLLGKEGTSPASLGSCPRLREHKKGAPADADAPEGIQLNASEGQNVTVASFEQVEVPASHTW